MAHLRVIAAVRGLNGKPRASSRRASGTRPAGDLLKRVGRVVLWCFVAVLLLRGAADLFVREPPAASVQAAPAAAAAWPDDPAKAFAVDFARAYLGYSPRDPEASADAVRALVTPDLADSVVPQYAKGAPAESVGAAAVARSAVVGSGRALITVAVDGGRYLTVPVARDGAGGLVVYDLPSFAAPPAHGAAVATSVDPLSGSERDAIVDVVGRYMKAFLAGDAQQLAYYAPPGAQVAALGRPQELVELVSVGQLAPPAGDARDVLATARVRDGAGGATFSLGYRLHLIYRDGRWLVADLNSKVGG